MWTELLGSGQVSVPRSCECVTKYRRQNIKTDGISGCGLDKLAQDGIQCHVLVNG